MFGNKRLHIFNFSQVDGKTKLGSILAQVEQMLHLPCGKHKYLTIVLFLQVLDLFNAQLFELFNVWTPVDSLGRIYAKAEEIAKNKKTSVDRVLSKANFDPIAYHLTLTGKGKDFVDHHESVVLDRIEKRNTLQGKIKGLFSIDYIQLASMHLSRGVTPISNERFDSLTEKLLRGDDHLFDYNDGQCPAQIGYSKRIASFIDEHRRPLGLALAAILIGGAAASSYVHGQWLKPAQYPAQANTDYTTLSKLISDFKQTVRSSMQDLYISEGEMKNLNSQSAIILSYTEGKDIGSIKIPDPIQATEIKDMVKAYTAYYNVDINDPVKLESTKLLPQHQDAFIKWFNDVDRSKLDYETKVRLDLIYNDIIQQNAKGTLNLYDVVTVSKFIDEKSQQISDSAHQDLLENLTKVKDVHDATDADMKYLETIKLPSQKSEDNKNFQTLSALTKDYYDLFPTMQKILANETEINGTKTTMTEAPILPEDRRLSFEPRYFDTLEYGALWTVGATAAALVLRSLVDRHSYSEDSSWGYGLFGLASGIMTHAFYDWFTSTGSSADYRTSMILHGIPVYVAIAGGLVNRANRWSRSRSAGCDAVRRSNLRDL
jgi:hypothetical protein